MSVTSLTIASFSSSMRSRTAITSSDFVPATRSISGMYILDLTDLEIESIDGIECIEFTLRIVNADNWNEIDTTDPIVLEFK